MENSRFVLYATDELATQECVQVILDGEICENCITACPGELGHAWKLISGCEPVIGNSLGGRWVTRKVYGHVQILVGEVPVHSRAEFRKQIASFLALEAMSR